MLAISRDELKQLVLTGILEPANNKRPLARYKISQCINFMRKYWSLHQWAKANQVNPKELLSFLNDHNIDGSISENIFTRSPELKKALMLFNDRQ